MYSVKISGNMHNKFIKKLHTLKGYTGKPWIYLVGADSENIIVDSATLRKGHSGCEQMPTINASEFARTMAILFKRNLTPVGIVRLKYGLNTTKYEGRRGEGLTDLYDLSPNAFCITYTGDKTIVDSRHRVYKYKVVPTKKEREEVKKHGKIKRKTRTTHKTTVRKKRKRRN